MGKVWVSVVLVALAAVGCSSSDSGTANSASPSTSVTSTTAAPTTARTGRDPDAVIAAFKAAGLEAESPRAMTPKDYGLAPLLATQGIRFFIPSLGPDNGGRVMTFENEADLQKVKSYYDDLAKQSAAFFSWTYAEGLTLVQINGDLPPETAAKYEAALRS